MKREVCKFFSGVFAGLAYTHVAYAVAISSGVLSEPVFRGRRWGAKYAWIEAATYTAVSAGLGYAGWRGGADRSPREPMAVPDDGRRDQPVAATEAPQPVI
ncbi:hypothetical protein ACTWP6_20880 [Mycobacterium sp. 4D054]|uniref:hypothetical protein n=1 Tax=unclassified Mycobacterium TaxID=2642494 RepID=UPI0021B1B9B1|nr:hypothetical protein [Mycobacterium sp. SMC-8]UXA10799.1 hypothetical protein KXD97_22365 [Mycobacterium sp. SMC-8]